MKVLVIGGSGYVGTRVFPFMKDRHTWRMFDLKPPADASFEYQQGSVTDCAALDRAAAGMDVLLYMAMNLQRGPELDILHSMFDVNVKGLYLALRAARLAGITHAVYCSSMSVYDGNISERFFFDEDIPPDSRGEYGFTKRLGEEVCRNAWYAHGTSVNALRLWHPASREEWREQAAQAEAQGKPCMSTDAADLARALLAALEYRNGFQAFQLSGDYENKVMNMGKARRLLGWEPQARLTS